MEREIYVPPTGPPTEPIIPKETYEIIGEEKIRDLVYNFYKKLELSEIRNMFPENMQESAKKSADFMIQVLGGPPLYSRKYGPPRMRARHLPFRIDEKARRVWLGCYKQALNESDIPEEQKELIWKFLVNFSAWMVNTKD